MQTSIGLDHTCMGRTAWAVVACYRYQAGSCTWVRSFALATYIQMRPSNFSPRGQSARAMIPVATFPVATLPAAAGFTTAKLLVCHQITT